MSVHSQINPLPSAMEIEKGGVGHIKRLEKSFKNANFEQDVMCYSNSFITDVIGSRKVGTILKYKAANKSPHIEHRKSFHEKLGLVKQRRLAIILKIRSKLRPFFFAIFEDSDLPPIIGSEIRELLGNQKNITWGWKTSIDHHS